MDDFSAQGRLLLVERQQGWIIETRKRRGGSRIVLKWLHQFTTIVINLHCYVDALVTFRCRMEVE